MLLSLTQPPGSVWRKTGLTITEFITEGKSFEYGIDGRKTLQLNFKVEVSKEDEVTINPDEHQAYRWCAEKDVGEVGVTDATFDVLKDAFTELHGNLPVKINRAG